MDSYDSLKNVVSKFREIREKKSAIFDTLGIYGNLAGNYDAIGRTDDSSEILEFVVGLREEKLGTSNPDVDDEKRRLTDIRKN
ncbi:hypothetical protein FXO38_09850 [Capsicum annuum]|uniref:Uncharacterized protein n=1 Tax=Capsicum annuum TaxID=4072 RepID=A0A2G2YFW3_CAPAN|nr:hypothetical protein FXO37_31285 [Capsicum annuum]KAF3664965.1 hypothetical protein FXO38_09850 [Capsicum annuum]PHT68599.1 hypothetical protein T459_28086 [Capsicum annuum]